MKSTVVLIVLGAILLCGGTANAWGGLFNRFSPEMLANMGYGGHGGGYRLQPYFQVNKFLTFLFFFKFTNLKFKRRLNVDCE